VIADDKTTVTRLRAEKGNGAMGKHKKKQACGSCGGKSWIKINLDNKEQKITCKEIR
jgi:ribosomal protein S27AE